MGEGVDEGTRALGRSDWHAAIDAFQGALESGESAEALEGVGLALWFEGRADEGIAARERAFTAYARRGGCHDAARMAVWVSHQHLVGGRPSASRGWLARAERVLENAEVGNGHGWVAVEQARHAVAVGDQVRHGTRALELARDHGDDDLEVFALSLLGRAEMNAGHRETGLRLLDEAMAAATTGRVGNVHTLAEAYCNLVMACSAAGEWERASEWCEHVEEFARSHRTAPLFSACRAVHGDVLLASGHWPEAEQALESALTMSSRYIPQLGAPAVATLAELRVQQGRLAEAEHLLAGREESPTALRALALLRIAEGQPQAASALLERGLVEAADDAVRAVQLLAALTDARLAAGDVEGARVAGDQLAGLADDSGMRLARARADLAAARVALADGRNGEARGAAQGALRGFSALAMPLDAGFARLELARAVRTDAPEVARDEARTALTTFRGLGAARAADAAAATLRELGEGGSARPRASGELTAREQEVLDLVALGMSNARIARALSISDKTAGHHVSRILAKLGVHNRTEAAAQAARRRDQ